MDDVITNHLQNAKHPTRRVFLSNCGEAALALTSSFLGRCSRQTLPSQRDNPISDANRALIADLEKRLPSASLTVSERTSGIDGFGGRREARLERGVRRQGPHLE